LIRSRYAILNITQSSLDFYHDEKSIVPEKLERTIALPEGSILVLTSSTRRLHLLQADGVKLYILETTNSNEHKAWVNGLTAAGITVMPALKEGYLYKTGNSTSSWNKRWFVLTSRAIYYYKTSDDEWKGLVLYKHVSFLLYEHKLRFLILRYICIYILCVQDDSIR